MTIQILQDQPSEKGTAVFSVSPVDEDGNALAFPQLGNPQWQMMMSDGSVVAGCAYADSTLTGLEWAIKGDQLALFGDSDRGIRIVTFKATYTSTAGSDLPLHAECKFKIQAMAGIPNEAG